MKTNRLLKMFSLLSVLLLVAPFYDHCGGYRMRRVSTEAVEVAIETTAVETDSASIAPTEINKVETDTVTNSEEEYEEPFYVKVYEFIDDDQSENAFEIAKLNSGYFETTFDEGIDSIKTGIKKNDYRGFFFGLKNFSFLLIVIITILIAFFAFKKSDSIHKLSKINLILLLISVICLFLEGLFESISQIKWGYYAFVITNILIFYFSKLDKSKIRN